MGGKEVWGRGSMGGKEGWGRAGEGASFKKGWGCTARLFAVQLQSCPKLRHPALVC